jgi:hypothetical protein
VTISKHTVTAQVITPVTYEDQGHYADLGSWTTLTTPAPIESNNFAGNITGWSKGTAVSVARATGSGVDGVPGFLYAYMRNGRPDIIETGTWYVTKALTGLTVGRMYKASTWVRPSSTAGLNGSAKIGVTGKAYGTSASFTPANYTTYQQVTYTFTATATAHTVELAMTYTGGTTQDRFLYVDDYALVATTVWTPNLVWQPNLVAIPGDRIPLDVVTANVKMDEAWAPYVQAQLECWEPPADVLSQIDPRTGARLRVQLEQRFGESEPASALPPTVSPTLTLQRTNLIPNPSFEVDTAGWLMTTSSGTLTRVTAPAGQSGAGCLSVTSAAAVAFGAGIANNVVAVTVGLTYTASTYVRAAATVRTATQLVDWYTSGGVYVSTSAGSGVADSAASWTRVTCTGIAPATAAFGRPRVSWNGAAISEVHYIDAALFEQSATASTYFDGSTIDTSTTVYDWTGTANASTSAQSLATRTAANLTAKYVGQQAAAISAEFGQPYNAFGMRPSTRKTLDLALRERTTNVVEGTMSLVAASDEALAMDARRVNLSPEDPGTSLVDAVEFGLRRIGANLTVVTDDQTLESGSATWDPGVSVWDYLTPLTDASERRLFCDENRVWHLVDPLQPGSGVIHVTPVMTSLQDTIDRDGDWYDAVVVEFRWNDALGVEQVRYDIAGPETATRVKHVIWNRRWVRNGAAAAMLARAQGQARSVGLTAVSDYSAEPGLSFNVTLPDGLYQVGMVSSVSWSWPGDEMSLTTRDLTTTPAHSWASLLPAVAWEDIPVGMDWLELETL